MARHKVFYADFDRVEDPKHQWLVRAFREVRFDRLEAELAANPHGTLILSCEGVMVQRSTFPPEAWPRFRTVLAGREPHLFLVQRNAGEWTRSLWKQGVLNAPVAGRIPVPDPDAFARLPWLAEMVALPDLARRLAEGDWLASFRAVAGLPDDPDFVQLARVHDSASDDFVTLYRELARGLPDVVAIRLALFACFCRAQATTNLTLLSVSRRFAALSPAVQADHLRQLSARLAMAVPYSDPKLVRQLASTAADWLARLPQAQG